MTHTQSRRSEPVELTPPQQEAPRTVPLEGLTLWEDADPAPPPTHRHSNRFSDPQTRPYAERLL